MKKVFLIFFVILTCLLVSCSRGNRLVIEIPEMSEAEVYIIYQDPDMINNRTQEEIVKTEIKNGKCNISLDTLQFTEKRKECSLTIVNKNKKFGINLPLMVEKGKTITLKIKGVSDYLSGRSILKVSYQGSRFAEDFSDFWQKINDSFIELTHTKNNLKMFTKQVGIYKDFITKYPESGYPYSVLISEMQMLRDNDNPVMKYCAALVNEKSDNIWHKYFVEAYKYKVTKQSTISTLVFSAQDKDGRVFTERDIKGRLVLVDFWASWCKPCLESLPKLKQIYDRFKEKGLTVVSISLDMNPNDWIKFSEKNSFSWLSLLGDGQEITQRYDFKYIPYFLIADEKGKILQRGIEIDKLEEFIRQYLVNN